MVKVGSPSTLFEMEFATNASMLSEMIERDSLYDFHVGVKPKLDEIRTTAGEELLPRINCKESKRSVKLAPSTR